MLCNECGKKQATVHITKVENGKKTDIHLCEACAMQKNVINISHNTSFSINDLLSSLLNSGSVPQMKMDIVTEVQCKICGLTYSQFRETGRFGCSNCYKTFGDKLNPVFKRVHGNTEHTGKIPNKAGSKIKSIREIEKLKKELEWAIKEEEYEKAAAIRDNIRALSSKPQVQEEATR